MQTFLPAQVLGDSPGGRVVGGGARGDLPTKKTVLV